jgi:hypothetical protein
VDCMAGVRNPEAGACGARATNGMCDAIDPVDCDGEE